jgi:hypothetical protein
MPLKISESITPALNIYREKCDQADERCRAFTEQFLDGTIDETALRRLILVEITEVNVVSSQIPRSYSEQWRDEAHTRIEDIIVRRFMETGDEAFFSPQRALMEKSSYIGAARNLALAALKTVNRDIGTSWRRTGLTVSSEDIDSIELQNNAIDLTVESAEDTTMARLGWGVSHDLAEFTDDHSKRLRTGNGRELNTRMLMSAYGLPDLIRLGVAERRELRTVIEDNHNAAYQSVAYIVGMRTGVKSKAPKPSEAMMSLWDDYTMADLSRVIEMSPQVARAAVLHAVSDRARPSRSVIREFSRSIVAAGTKGKWGSVAKPLARLYIALECEAIAVCDATKSDSRDEREAGREMLIATEKETFKALFDNPEHIVLGYDREEVMATLSHQLDKATGLGEILTAGLAQMKVAA